MEKLIACVGLGALLITGFAYAEAPTDLTMDREPSVLSIQLPKAYF